MRRSKRQDEMNGFRKGDRVLVKGFCSGRITSLYVYNERYPHARIRFDVEDFWACGQLGTYPINELIKLSR